MTRDEAIALGALARARTLPERKAALESFLACGIRLPDDIREEVAVLLSETRSAVQIDRQFRPTIDPSKESALLARVTPGPDPILPASLIAGIEEWCLCWQRRADLVAAGVALPGPLLFSGPTGIGKSMMVAAIARRFEPQATVCLDAHRVVQSYLGSTGANLSTAVQLAERAGSVLAVAVEEVDALGMLRGDPKQHDVGEMARVTIALMRILDERTLPVVMTTNRLDRLDPALVRRCEDVLKFPVPDEVTKRQIVEGILGEPFSDATWGGDGTRHMDLPDLVARARKARRRAVIRGLDVVAAFQSI